MLTDPHPPQSLVARWVVVMPVKMLTLAKSRLSALGPDRRAALALAMALDTMAAALGCPHVHAVLAVTNDDVVRRSIDALGDPRAGWVPDRPDRGLDAALEEGAAAARDRWPDCWVASLSSDLPALTAKELTVVLEAAADHPRALVADAGGTGTVLLTARNGPLGAAYGSGSRARHLSSGAIDVTDQAGGGLRRDVDTPEDLIAALLVGVGPATAECDT